MAGWYWYKEGKEIAVLTFVSRGLEMAFSMPLTINARHSYPNWSVRTLAYMVGEWLGPITPDDRQQGRVAGLREGLGVVNEAQQRDRDDATLESLIQQIEAKIEQVEK